MPGWNESRVRVCITNPNLQHSGTLGLPKTATSSTSTPHLSKLITTSLFRNRRHLQIRIHFHLSSPVLLFHTITLNSYVQSIVPVVPSPTHPFHWKTGAGTSSSMCHLHFDAAMPLHACLMDHPPYQRQHLPATGKIPIYRKMTDLSAFKIRVQANSPFFDIYLQTLWISETADLYDSFR
jgi:hypothetical protein